MAVFWLSDFDFVWDTGSIGLLSCFMGCRIAYAQGGYRWPEAKSRLGFQAKPPAHRIEADLPGE